MIFRALFFLLLICCATACAPNPDVGSPQLAAAVRQMLQYGQVTRAQVGDLLGPPASVSSRPESLWNRTLSQSEWPAGTQESWSYYAKDVSGHGALDPDPVTVRSTRVSFFFDDQGELVAVHGLELSR